MLSYKSLILLCDFQNRSFVSRWVLSADVPIDFFTVGVEIDIRWPSIDSKACGGFCIPLCIDSYGQDMLADSCNQLGVFESFLFEHSAWGAMVSIEMDQHGFSGSLGQFHCAGKIFRPCDFGGVFTESKIC